MIKLLHKTLGFALLLSCAFFFSTNAQTTVTTGLPTSVSSGSGASYFLTFVISNTNPNPITITDIAMYRASTSNGNVYRLFYSTTSLSGSAGFPSAAWTLIDTSILTPATTTAIYPTFTGLNFAIPGNTVYRFLVQTSGSSLNYGGAANTVNSFSGGGVTIGTGNYQVNSANVGYWGNSTNPRFWCGSVTFLSGPPCPAPTAPLVSNITMTSADFSWAAVTGSQGYEYAVTTTATPPTTGTATMATTYNATALNNGTNYWFHVRNVCTTGTSYSQWVTVPFSTVACPSVTGVTVSGITTIDATINWNTISGTLGYEYALDNSASPPASGTMQTTTSYSAASLTPGTQYYFHIRNHCTSPSNSVWTNVPFTTLACPSAGAPSIVTNVPGSVTFTWPGTSTPGVINYQYKVSTSASTPTTWLTTNNTTATDATLIPGTTYYAHVRSNCGTSSGDQFVQFINPYPPCFAPGGMSITGVNMHGANIVWNSTTAGNVSGYEYMVSNSATPPSTGTPTTDTFYTATGLTPNTQYYVHVRTHCGNLANYSAWITDSFATPATCIIYTPSNVQIANVTPHTAQISWQDYPGIYGYEYVIDNISSSPPFAGAAVTYNIITPQNLYSGTSYYLHLRIQCDSFNYSPWLNVPFNTPAVCTAPATASVTNITSNSASFSWSPVSSAQSYEYDVSTSSTPNPSGLYTSNSNVSVNALQPSTNYYFHVRALCSSNDLSEWKTTAFNTYATSIVTVAGNKDFSLNVYPNPVKEVLNIEVTGNRKGKGTVMLLDLSGKLIDQIELSSDKGQLNLSNVANGLYLLRYRDSENTETMRIQKQ